MPPKKAKTSEKPLTLRSVGSHAGRHIASYLQPEYEFGKTARTDGGHALDDLRRLTRERDYEGEHTQHSNYAKGRLDKSIAETSGKIKKETERIAAWNYSQNTATAHPWLWDDTKSNDVRSEYDPLDDVMHYAKTYKLDLDRKTLLPKGHPGSHT